jgi:Fe2+ or Zn2+ uptake regulation protein
MKPVSPISTPDEMIHGRGLRMTEQRRTVYEALMEERNHPTAVEVFMRARHRMSSISLATVYNCLETLSSCGLVKTVNLERGPARYCPNIQEHAHFYCNDCGAVLDLPLRARRRPEDVWALPEQLSISHHEVAFRGVCPDCASRPPKQNAARAKE